MAWIELKSLMLSTLSHRLLHGLGQPPGQLLFKLEALNFALFVLFEFLAFLPSTHTSKSMGDRGFQVYSACMQVLLPRAINTSTAVLEGSRVCFLLAI